MKFDPPRLVESSLTEAVYVVTHGKIVDAEQNQIIASVKYDVTDQFEALVVERQDRAKDLGETA